MIIYIFTLTNTNINVPEYYPDTLRKLSMIPYWANKNHFIYWW